MLFATLYRKIRDNKLGMNEAFYSVVCPDVCLENAPIPGLPNGMCL